MSEVSRICEEYLNDNPTKVMCYGNQEKSLSELNPFLQELVEFERPDAFSKIGEDVLIVEHFEFDSTNTNKKGSLDRIEQARIERDFEKDLNKLHLQSGETFHKHDTVNVTHSSENYIKNALNAFRNHYEKIESYKQNLSNEGIITNSTNIKTMFWIEDTTLLGNAFIPEPQNYNSIVQPLILLHCDKFLEALKDCKKLDYIFCFSHYGMQKFCWFLDLNYLNDYISKQIKIDNVKIIDFKPHTTGYVTVFKKEEV